MINSNDKKQKYICQDFKKLNKLIIMSGQIAKIGLIASMFSVVGSLYIYFVGDNENLGIFVGLWAPTLILASNEIESWMEN